MDPSRRSILAAGAAATALAAAQRVFGRQTGQGGTDIPFYERGPVRIYYEEAGSGMRRPVPASRCCSSPAGD